MRNTQTGAHYLGENTCVFRVWAPDRKRVDLAILTHPSRELAMDQDNAGYWQIKAGDVAPGTHYQFRLDGTTQRPDPASHHQPEGVHGPSAVVDHSDFTWTDTGWEGVRLQDMIIYELHVGTFTPEGTFASVIPRLSTLRDLGVTAIELMPLAQFPGQRNWGYDGVYPYAVQASYGGPQGLKALVNAIHRAGMSVILDVVYNHLGPEGNYLRDFGPYFTDFYQTPWGQAINFDQAHSHHVREFFIRNALYWLREYHIDALRLDAVHAIYDSSAKHILTELSERVARFSHQTGIERYLIAESALNDVRVIKPRSRGGLGMDAQWSDDFHHSLHALLTGERNGYYQDYGGLDHLLKAFQEGFTYTWQFSKFRQRKFGSSARRRPSHQFVICSQNHDQIGNRMLGERLNQLVDFETLKLAAGTLLLAPYVPLLFMGQAYAEPAPFLYFVSHSDEALVETVRQGRRQEFTSFEWDQDCPDPQAVETFTRSRLNWALRKQGQHRVLWRYYRDLIALRKRIPSVTNKKSLMVRALPTKQVILWQRQLAGGQLQCLINFSHDVEEFDILVCQGDWIKQLDSAATEWAGPGATLPQHTRGTTKVKMPARSLALYRNQEVEPRAEHAAEHAQAFALAKE